MTTFNREANGGLNSVSLPNGDTWLYTHDPDDDKIKKITAPDGETTTEVTYVEGGLAMHQIGTVRVYDRPTEPRNLISDLAYTYDSQGRLTQVTKDGKTVTYDYVVSGPDTITVTDTSAVPQTVTVYEYGGDTTTVTRMHSLNPADPLNQVTTYTYYTSGGKKTYLYQVTDALGNTTTYDTYTSGDLKGKVYKITDALTRETDYDYDADTGALTKITYPAVGGIRHTEEYTYYLDSQNNKTQWLKTVKNVRGNYTHYVRAQGSLHQVDAVKVSAPVGGQEPDWDTVDPIRTYEYYPQDDPYDQKGLLKKEIVPDIDGTIDQEREYEYWELVNQVPKLRQGVTKAKYQYWTGSAYAWGQDTTSYDAMGDAISTKDNNNREITYTCDDLGRQLTTTYRQGVYTESHYDCCALEWTKDEDGRYTYYAYDGAKRVTDSWTSIQGGAGPPPPAAPLVHYDYDSFGNVWKVTTRSDAATPRVTEYLYDKNNRVERINYPAPLGFEQFEYDGVGNLRGKKDGEGVVTAYEYDELNRLIKVDYNHGSWPVVPITTPDVTYEYAGGSRLRESMVDASGTSEYTYDIRDRLETYTPPQPAGHAALVYTYNNLNQKTGITTTGYSVSYAYYANGWLKQVTFGGQTIATYLYDSVGNRDRVNLGNGTYTTYVYDADPRYRTSEIRHYTGNPPTQVNEILYHLPDGTRPRDGAGNPTSMVDWTGQTLYSYDMNSRLTSATYPVIGEVDYNYDWVGNRVNPPAPPNPMEYNPADELTRWPAQHQYNYDGIGNLFREWSDPRGVDPQRTHTYSAANLLASVQHGPGGPVSQMTWDADANRLSFTSSTGGAYAFLYDRIGGVPAVIQETTPVGAVSYVREPEGELIARIDGANTHYYHFNELGSTTLLTDANGNVTDEYTYDAWGNASHPTGSTQQPYEYVGQLGYYSHYQDGNFPLLQLGVRFYDPQAGRFTQGDPIESSPEPSTYLYTLGNPLLYTDPDGLKTLDPGWLKKAAKCSKKAFDKCRSKIGNKKDFEKCYWTEFAKCMGKSWTRASCISYFCRLFPKATECANGQNPCDVATKSPRLWQDCCNVKFYCCLAINISDILASEKCRNENTLCHLEVCKIRKPK